MSTDLEFFPAPVSDRIGSQTEPAAALSNDAVMMPSSDPENINGSRTTTTSTSTTRENHHNHQPQHQQQNDIKIEFEQEDEAEEKLQTIVRESPKTPTAAEHRIPTPSSPPPAPRKRRRVAVNPSCKRRLEFFIPDNDQEIQDFFTTSFAKIESTRILKRRCPCV